MSEARRDNRPDLRAGKKYRIKRNKEISRIFQQGRRASDSLITLRALPNADMEVRARLGVAVTKRHGGAVRRNRIKRLCREAFRLVRYELPGGYDYVILPHVGAELTLEKLIRSLKALAPRATGRQSREMGS